MLLRHGQSERNVMKDAAKASGTKPVWSDGVRDQDTPLTQLGQMQALAVGVALRKKFPAVAEPCPGYADRCGDNAHGLAPIDIMYVSPYLRTRQTADFVIEGLGYKPKGYIIEERIREIEFGILDGLTPDGIAAKYPEEIARRKKEGKYFYRPPGGQNRPDVNLQIHSFLGTLTRSARQKRVFIVCHSVVVMCFRHLLERWGEDDYLQVDREQDVMNASLTTYASTSLTNKLILQSFNEILYPQQAGHL